MHLLNVQPGTIDDGDEAVDIGQTPADIVILSAADTELATLAAAHGAYGPNAPSLRLASLLQLRHPMSVDLYTDQTLSRARIVIVRLLGGRSYWPYGVEQLIECAQTGAFELALLPGDDKSDDDLRSASTIGDEFYDRLWAYFIHGGGANARGAIALAAALIDKGDAPPQAAPLLAAGLYWPNQSTPGLADLRSNWTATRPLAAITFYRALLQSGQTETIDALITALASTGLNALPVYAQSFKDPLAAGIVTRLFAEAPPQVVINLTGFALSAPGHTHAPTLLDAPGGVVLQAVMAGVNRDAWEKSTRGLGTRDIAMNVALPEIDGRLHARAIAFKTEQRFDAVTETPIVVHRPDATRVTFTARLAANWAQLGVLPAKEKRVALVLANYPNRDGRIGNGVGLDTPASSAALITDLAAAGFDVPGAPRQGKSLMDLLLAGPTNAPRQGEFANGEQLPLADYCRFFKTLPADIQTAIEDRWGSPEDDPMVADGAFHLPLHRFGNLAIGIQPARGYNIDPKASYHDPDLVPPHF